jgi:predicted pyridoxine 5'-phosphate oxidase superfamily flavin-nucleotide-binding protein
MSRRAGVGDETNEPAFHSGERAVQARVGYAERMAVVGERAIRKHMPEQHRQFFGQLPFVLVGSIDQTGKPWASVLSGPPGFAHSPNAAQLRIHASCTPGDPLCTNLRPGAQVGMLGLQPHMRRRNRANGVLTEVGTHGFTLAVSQSFGNCPKYIQAREARYTSPRPTARFEPLYELSEAAARLIRSADTFFVATAHPDAVRGGTRAHGADVTHRGGYPGFVRLDARGHLTVPDFVGNFFFNTLGNLAVHPFAGLLFIDYVSGNLLSLAATASLIWDGPEVAAFAGAQRLVRFTPMAILFARAALPLHWGPMELSPHLTGTGTW